MVTLKEILAAKNFHERGLPPGAMRRWAFLVTPEELNSIVDEIKENPEYGITLTDRYEDDIRGGRAMLNINGLPILPELLPPEAPSQPA